MWEIEREVERRRVSLLLEIITKCAATCRNYKNSNKTKTNQKLNLSPFQPQLAGKTISLALIFMSFFFFSPTERGRWTAVFLSPLQKHPKKHQVQRQPNKMSKI